MRCAFVRELCNSQSMLYPGRISCSIVRLDLVRFKIAELDLVGD